MDKLIVSVRKALDDKNWFAGLFLSLTFPDICGAIEFPTLIVSTRYKYWYNKYLLDDYNNLSADDCYRLRCACLHEGKDSDIRMVFKKYILRYLKKI